MKLSSVQVDIIIPIYNAYEELCKCIDSIKKWTSLVNNRLILINDNSTDERIKTFLAQIEQEEKIIIIHNEANKGFSANINIGIEQSKDRDVIFLNSDTIVTKDWVEKLVKCAYSNDMIATVTPLSNNATLCSVPDFCEENSIPDGYSLDDYAELIENVSFKHYPKIPVANGFCMYVKRSVLAEIGGLDEAAFERGYGEENDFCYRAIEAGYYHVMCDDTFILHTGTSSFLSDEKRKYIQEHELILEERYPDLVEEVRAHCRNNPNRYVGENIRFWSEFNRCEKRERILYLLQSDFCVGAENNVGGTQLHVKDLVKGLRNESDIVVVARNGQFLNVSLYTEEKEFFFKYYIGNEEKTEKYRSKKFSQIYKKIIETFQIKLIHIHHTKGVSLEMFYVAAELKIPLYVTLHDFNCICPNEKLLDCNKKVCIGKTSEEHCKKCLKKMHNISDTVPFLHVWRKQHFEALKLADKIIVPSESTREIVLSFYPEMKEKMLVVSHGSDLEVEKNTFFEMQKRKFNVAFVGGINEAKGYAYAMEMINKSNASIKWHLFGEFERKNWRGKFKRNFIDVGNYEREQLPKLFSKYNIDLVCILPIWPETFCYTISEAVMCGVPVIVTDMGALSQRVKDMGCGWIVEKDVTAIEILKKIYEIRNNKKEYLRVREKVKDIKIKSVKGMCDEYRMIYLLDKNVKMEKSIMDNEWLVKGLVNVKDGRFFRSHSVEILQEQVQILEYNYEKIEKNNYFKLYRWIKHKNIPGKTIVKKAIKKIILYGKKRKLR